MRRDSTVFVTLGFVALGVALRLLQYGIPRSLWFDEARNAAEILKDHWLMMLPPHSAQPTPFGFLNVERAFVAVLGEGELALRLFPLFAGIAALCLAATLAHRVLRGWAAPFAVALLALSGPAIYFSTEVKQYSSDLLAGLLVAHWFTVHESPPKPRQVALFALFGAIAVWISYTSIFFLAVAGTMLIAGPLRVRDWRGTALYAGMGLAWLASFALHYQFAIAHWSETRWLTAFWSAGFPREGEGIHALLGWSLAALIAVFENPLGVTFGGRASACIAGLLFALGVARALGVVGTLRGHDVGNRVLILLAGVFALAFACALLHIYPFKARLLLFLLPSMAFLVAHGMEWLVRTALAWSAGLRSSVIAAAIATAAMLLAGDAWSALRLLKLEPLHRQGTVNLVRAKGALKSFEGVSEVARYVARNHEPGDVVYLYYSAEPGWAYYARQLGLRAQTITGVRSQGDYRGYASDLDALRGNARVWIVFSHTVDAEKQFFVRHLENRGQRLDHYRRPRADAYLFDLAASPGNQND